MLEDAMRIEGHRISAARIIGRPISSAGGSAIWTPDAELAGVTNSFWADPLASSVLFQDAGLTTPANATNDPIGGVDNQSTIGTATLSQATTADKLKVSADGRIERDGTVNTQDLEFGLTINLANGFCFALDADVNISTGLFGEDSNLWATSTSGGELNIRMGGTTSRQILGFFSPLRRRLVITGNGIDFEVFGDGVSFGTFATLSAKTVFSNIVLGKISNSGTSAIASKYGRILFAEKDFRSVINNLDAWLEG